MIATFPLFQHSTNISNHGDINRGLIYSGVAQESILAGHMPTWNPYLCGGSPLLGDVESWFLQPFFFLTLPFDELLAMKVSFALTLCTAFVGFVVLGRRVLGFQHLGALTFGLIMAFGGYISQHLAEGYFVWVSSAWIPWFLLAGITSIKNIRYVPVAGLMLAFMFGAGSMHMVVYSLLFLGLVFLFMSFRAPTRNPRVLFVLLGIVFFFILFAAIKLIPVLSVLETNESRLGFTPAITLLPQMLFARGSLPAIPYNGDVYRWGEFGNYIGYISIALVLFALMHKRDRLWKNYKPFFLASAVILVLAFTSFPITHGVVSKVGDLFRMPSRLMFFPVIGIAILAAHGMELISTSFPRRRESTRLDPGSEAGMTIALIIMFMLAADLISNDYTMFARTFSVPLPEEIHVESKFMRVKHSYTTSDEKYYRAAYIDYLENRGVNDLCRFYQHTPATSAINGSDKKKPDRGEVYLVDTKAGSVNFIRRDDQKFVVAVDIKQPTSLMVNMNYYSGWKTKEGFPVQDRDGLIEVVLPIGANIVTLLYGYYST
ncbi:MAG: hypothetical protein A3C02_02400 [Candidatus Andersenbacteria bacterium RIFCSPHIGHO2_02_FULL_45_11]|nr:MAG: hypothetical protein A3C02_02400 [Candidatus Andersenbacteria bacterium RIFCSPHIGHO2_02_FULL_45_11]